MPTIEVFVVVKSILLTCAACVVSALAVPAGAQGVALHPPAALVAAAGELRPIGTLGDLPANIRTGVFTLPGGEKAGGWVLAEPGGRWNPTDTIVDPSLPSRRMIVALCNASLCALSYERGGIAHVYYVAGFARTGSAWKLEWLASGNHSIVGASALAAFLRAPSSSGYRDDPNPGRDC